MLIVFIGFGYFVCAQAPQKNMVNKLTIQSYRNLYGKDAESAKLINLFDRRRKQSSALIGTAGFLSSVSSYFIGTAGALVGIPLLIVGITERSIYSKKKLVGYLTHSREIPPNLKNRINKQPKPLKK